MRVDLLQLLRKLLGILSTAAAIAETVQAAVGQPGQGRRAADPAVSQLAGQLGIPTSSIPPAGPPGRPAEPIGTGVEVPRAAPGPGPGETITR